MFKDTKKEIQRENTEANQKLESIKEKLKEAERQIQEQVKKSLITEVLNFQKIIDPAICYDERLKGGNEKQIKKACGTILEPGKAPDLKLLINCMNPKFFCQICCNENIGEAYEDKRTKCKTRCFGMVFAQDGNDNNWLISFNTNKEAEIGTKKSLDNNFLNQKMEDEDGKQEIVEGYKGPSKIVA